MSYDVAFRQQGRVVRLDRPHTIKGGTYALGGTPLAEFNITWNYHKHFRVVLGGEGLRSLYGRTAGDLLPVLAQAVKDLGGAEPDDNYWAPTQGNAAAALADLAALAALCPADAVLTGD